MKKAFATLSLLFLAGCATQPPQTGVVNILDEVNALQAQLGCQWTSYPDEMYPVKGEEYACVLDRFNSVMFFVKPSGEILDEGAPAIEKITLIWKEWHDNAHIVDGRVPASRAIAYVAQRFFPEDMAMEVVDTFLGTANKNLQHNNLRVRYRYDRQLTLNLHQMDIYNTDRHKRMFANEPRHSHQPEPAEDKTPERTSSKEEGK